MHLFSPAQLKTLKTTWILVLIWIALRVVFTQLLMSSIQRANASGDLPWRILALWAGNLSMLLALGWDIFLRGNKDEIWKYLLVALAGLAVLVVIPWNIQIVEIYALLLPAPLLLGRATALNGARQWQPVLVLMVVYWVGMHVARSFSFYAESLGYVDLGYWGAMLVMPVTIVTASFMVENYFDDAAYAERLQDKLAVTDNLSFAMLYICAATLVWSCAFSIYEALEVFGSNHYGSSHPTLLGSCTKIFAAIAVLIYAVPVLWNAIVARALTTHRTNFVLLALHAVPVLNLIPLAVLVFSKDKNTSEVDNENTYLGQDRRLARNILLVLVALGCVYSIYAGFLQANSHDFYGAIGYILIVLNLARLAIVFTNSPKRAPALYLFNIIGAVFNALLEMVYGNKWGSLELGAVILSVILLCEVLRPKLGNDLIVYPDDPATTA